MEHPTIAFVFDFDDTLAPDSTSSFLQSRGVDTAHFWGEQVASLISEGWDSSAACFYKLISLNQTLGSPITQQCLQDWGKGLQFYSGVDTLFPRLIKHAHTLNPEIKVEFYLISGGFGDIIRHTAISPHFTNIWSCEFHYNDNQQISFPKRIVNFTDKTRYLFQVSKGVVAEEALHPSKVNYKTERQELRIPLNQMIFVGDGYTDIPCFSLVKKAGGTPIAVCDEQNSDRAAQFLQEKRVDHWALADYTENSALSTTLLSALANTMKKIEHKK